MKIRDRARRIASEINSTLPHGEVVRIITSALKKQEKENDLKYEKLLDACQPVMTGSDLSETEKCIFTAMVNIGINGA